VRSIGASSQPASRSCGVAEARAVVCSAHVAPQATDRLKLCVRLPIRPTSPNHVRCLCRRFKARLGQKRTNVLKCCWCVVLVPTLVDFVATFVGMPALASLKLLKLVRVVGFLQPVSYGEHQLLFERAGLLLHRAGSLRGLANAPGEARGGERRERRWGSARGRALPPVQRGEPEQHAAYRSCRGYRPCGRSSCCCVVNERALAALVDN
jgi:hypothetical protein